jgi:hypothetical protein
MELALLSFAYRDNEYAAKSGLLEPSARNHTAEPTQCQKPRAQRDAHLPLGQSYDTMDAVFEVIA